MKYYFFGLATLVAVCVGCQSSGSRHLGQSPDECPPMGPMGTMGPMSGPGMNGAPIMAASHRRHCPPYVAPPAEMMLRPGPMVDGPGPGVLNSLGMAPARTFASTTTQIRFVGPEGMQIGWQIPTGYAENQVSVPGRYNFRQGATYRLKLSMIPSREALVLYPTLQVYPSHPQTDAYLSHNSVPLQLSDEDLDQVESNNFVTKVIYLPSPAHQEFAIAGVETLVSTRLDPGVDPVAEADRLGTIMAVLRMGNMDLETPEQVAGVSGVNGIQKASHVQTVDGELGQRMPPVPIHGGAINGPGMPAPMIMGVPGAPGQPAYGPMGVGTSPTWGTPMTGTPIGLPGPPHLPYGGPAGLQSYTVRNRSRQYIPKPVDHLLVDVKQRPGVRLPDPVKHIQYEESHPIYEEVPAGD